LSCGAAVEASPVCAATGTADSETITASTEAPIHLPETEVLLINSRPSSGPAIGKNIVAPLPEAPVSIKQSVDSIHASFAEQPE
jgi:hypothetical protein